MPPVNSPAMASADTRSLANQRSPPVDAAARSTTPPPLEYLSSPVPDLAATLHTPAAGEVEAAEEADEANVSFLRESLEPPNRARDANVTRTRNAHNDRRRDPRRSAEAAVDMGHSGETAEDLSRRTRLQRVLARLNRLHEPLAQPPTSAYSNRIPSPNQQSIYDWAPSYEGAGRDENELDAILNELRRQQPETHPELLRSVQDQIGQYGEEQHVIYGQVDGTTTSEARAEPSLPELRDRMSQERDMRRRVETAVLRTRMGDERQRQDGSPSATDRMLRYVVERERSGMSEEEERARGSGWFRPSPNRAGNEEQRRTPLPRDSWLLPPPANSDARDRERQERVEAFRRGYLAENVPPRLPRISTQNAPASAMHTTAAPTAFLENALGYLSDLRECSRYEESLSTAIDHGLATKEFFADKHDDFIMDLDAMDPLPYSSWLQPGTVFDGHQHATNGACISISRNNGRPSSSGTVTHVVEQINPNFGSRPSMGWDGFDHPPGSTRVVLPAFDATRPWLSHQFTPPTTYPALSVNAPKQSLDSPHDHWPVRVILHSIDTETMTLQGTMEAYDVPQHPANSLSILNPTGDRAKAGKKNAPITTYLEGHIIDLRTHSFLTPGPPENKKHGGGTPRNPPPAPPRPRDPNTNVFPAATPQTDAQNWLNLPPFSSLMQDKPTSSTTSPSDEAARLLLSQARMHELNSQYIFMRWKERCFVHTANDTCAASETERHGDQDRGHGLTISGFYYISLRRSDGCVEGLYFDPSSTPFQHLRLQGQAGGWPAFGFR